MVGRGRAIGEILLLYGRIFDVIDIGTAACANSCRRAKIVIMKNATTCINREFSRFPFGARVVGSKSRGCHKYHIKKARGRWRMNSSPPRSPPRASIRGQ